MLIFILATLHVHNLFLSIIANAQTPAISSPTPSPESSEEEDEVRRLIDSCNALDQAINESRAIRDERRQKWRRCKRRRARNMIAATIATWGWGAILVSSLTGKKCSDFHHASKIAGARMADLMNTRAAQDCPVPDPNQCTPGQVKSKEEMEALVGAETNLNLICENCECDIEDPEEGPESTSIKGPELAGLIPEIDQMKIPDKDKKTLKNLITKDPDDPTYENDLAAGFGDFASTESEKGALPPGLASLVSAGPPPTPEEKVGGVTVKEAAPVAVTFAPPSGVPTQPREINKDAKSHWIQEAKKEKSGIMGDERRGLFAAVSGRYEVVEDREFKEKLNVIEGRFQSVKADGENP